MRPGIIRPTGVERPLGLEEIIVSKTDLRGHITYVNDVFVRVSGFSEQELIGRPHNVIRHPAMPRAVFALLWERLGSGQELFAYIVNLAKDGGHYWVFAHVSPTYGEDGRVTGYHSNRRAVDPQVRERIEPLYASMLAEEARHERRSDAIQASRQMLQRHLDALGMDYDEFVWSLTVGEEHERTAA